MTTQKLYAASFGAYLYNDDEALNDSDSDFSGMNRDASMTLGYHVCGGIRLLDSDASHFLTVTWGEDDSANRTLGFLVAGGNRTITLNENFIVGDGYDFTVQALGQANALVLNENLTVADGYAVTLQALGQANQLTLNEGFTIGDGNAGTLTFSAASKVLTVEDNSIVNQDLTTDAGPTFASCNLGTGELTAGSVNRVSGTFTLEIGGAAQVSILTTSLTITPSLILSTCINAASDVDKFLVLDGANIVDFRTGAEVLSDIGGAAGVHTHDGDTLQLDGVNSNGGAFSFTTSGAITFLYGLNIDTTGGNAYFNLTTVSDNAPETPQFMARRARVGPAAVQNGDKLGQFSFRGHDGVSYTLSRSLILVTAAENWNATSHGTKLSFQATPNGSTTIAAAVDIYGDGVFMNVLKSGANQGAAGAAANELWVDTADQTIKLGV